MQSADITLRLPRSMQVPLPVESVDEVLDREELLSWHVDPEEETVSFLSLFVGDAEALADLATDLEFVHRYDIAPVDEDAFYGYAVVDLWEAEATIFGTLEMPGLVIVPPVVYTGREHVHVTVLGDPEAMTQLLDRFPDEVDIEIERVSEHQRRSETLAGRLTARQFEAMETARELGYYDVPRSSSLAAVAAELDCSESAASTLLRTVESELVDAALGR